LRLKLINDNQCRNEPLYAFVQIKQTKKNYALSMTENRNVYLNGKRMLQKSEGTKLQLIRKRYFESDFDIYP